MLVRRLPILLLAVGGIVFALLRWKLQQRASLMTVIALVVFLIDAFAYSILLYLLADIFRPLHLSGTTLDWLYFFVYVLDDFVFAVVIVLLFLAAFSQRNTTTADANA
jgi:hypothetical protein